MGAYRILSDPETRRLYDDYGFEGLRSDFDPRTARNQGNTSQRHKRAAADDIFSDIFDGRSPFDTSHMRDFGGFDASFEQGQHLSADLTVDMLTAIVGGPATVRLPHGDLDIDIPEGARDGDILELRGQGGEPATHTGVPGDLTINLHVRPHERLRRRGLNLYLDVPVTITEAIKGATIVVPTPRGDFEVRVPSGVHTGTKLRLGGQGVRREGRQGDFFAVVQVYTPDWVDEEIEEAAEVIGRGYSEDVRKDLEL